jgi:hypothetical protein
MAVTAVVLPISGPYSATWNAVAMGVNGDDGFTIRCQIQAQEFNESDAWGLTFVEGIYRGQNWRCRLVGREWKAGLLSILQTFGLVTGGGTLNPFIQVIGDRMSKYAFPLVLTAILGNPPSVPQSLTANGAIIAPDNNSEFNFTSKIRDLPLELAFIPYSTSTGSPPATYTVPFTVT